jgi:amino acid transporter
VFALLGLALVTGINCYSTKLGASASNAFFIVKVFMLLAIAIIGIVAMPHFRDVGALNSDIFTGSSLSFGDYAIALYAGLWAYDGWDNMNYVSAEMKNARRDLPRVIHIAMPAVIIAYLLANISYFAILSKEEILSTTTVALTFADKIFGRVGRLIFALLISFSCIGALNATMFGSARLVYSSAEEGFLPSVFSKIHPTRATPVNALLLQAATTAFFVLVGEFQTLLTFYGVAGYIFFFLSVFGVIVLRIREPDLERPYKTWITTPIMFCCVALFLVSRTIFEKPLEAFFALAFIAAGCPIFIYKFGCPFNWDGLLRKLRLKK